MSYHLIIAEEMKLIQESLYKSLKKKTKNVKNMKEISIANDVYELNSYLNHHESFIILLSNTFTGEEDYSLIHKLIEEYSNIYIIGMSNRFQDKTCLEYGAVEYLDKPFRQPVLWRKIDSVSQMIKDVPISTDNQPESSMNVENNNTVVNDEPTFMIDFNETPSSSAANKNIVVIDDDDDDDDDLNFFIKKKTAKTPNTIQPLVIDNELDKKEIVEKERNVSSDDKKFEIKEEKNELAPFQIAISKEQENLSPSEDIIDIPDVSQIHETDVPHETIILEKGIEEKDMKKNGEVIEKKLSIENKKVGLKTMEEGEEYEKEEKEEEHKRLSLDELIKKGPDKSMLEDIETIKATAIIHPLLKESTKDAEPLFKAVTNIDSDDVNIKLDDALIIPTDDYYKKHDEEQEKLRKMASIDFSKEEDIQIESFPTEKVEEEVGKGKEKEFNKIPEKQDIESTDNLIQPTQTLLEPKMSIKKNIPEYNDKNEWLECQTGFLNKEGQYVYILPPRNKSLDDTDIRSLKKADTLQLTKDDSKKDIDLSKKGFFRTIFKRK